MEKFVWKSAIYSNRIFLALFIGVEPYSKCPYSNHHSHQRIQILGYHISVDAVLKDKIFNTQNIVYIIEIKRHYYYQLSKKLVVKKNYTEKEK